jgi:hypothetical protein
MVELGIDVLITDRPSVAQREVSRRSDCKHEVSKEDEETKEY